MNFDHWTEGRAGPTAGMDTTACACQGSSPDQHLLASRFNDAWLVNRSMQDAVEEQPK